MTNSRARAAYQAVRKEEILDAAMGVLVRSGSEVSLQEIADAVGLTRGALYRYFPSKEALTREVFARCFHSTKLAIEGVLQQSGSPAQALLSLIEISARWYKQEGAREEMVLNLQAALETAQGAPEGKEPPTVIDSNVVESALRLARQASAAGELRPEVDPAGFALVVLSTLQGLQMLIAMFGDTIDSDAATDTLLAAVQQLLVEPALAAPDPSA